MADGWPGKGKAVMGKRDWIARYDGLCCVCGGGISRGRDLCSWRVVHAGCRETPAGELSELQAAAVAVVALSSHLVPGGGLAGAVARLAAAAGCELPADHAEPRRAPGGHPVVAEVVSDVPATARQVSTALVRRAAPRSWSSAGDEAVAERAYERNAPDVPAGGGVRLSDLRVRS